MGTRIYTNYKRLPFQLPATNSFKPQASNEQRKPALPPRMPIQRDNEMVQLQQLDQRQQQEIQQEEAQPQTQTQTNSANIIMEEDTYNHLYSYPKFNHTLVHNFNNSQIVPTERRENSNIWKVLLVLALMAILIVLLFQFGMLREFYTYKQILEHSPNVQFIRVINSSNNTVLA